MKKILSMPIETVVVFVIIIVWLCIQNYRIDVFEKKINGRVYDMYESFNIVMDSLSIPHVHQRHEKDKVVR